MARHAFYPLISYVLESEKVHRDREQDRLIRESKKRPISYAAHADSHIYSYYAHLLGAIYETRLAERGLTKAVLAFRALERSNIEHAKQAFDDIAARGDCVAIALDVTKFFDSLDHASLKAAWCALLRVDRLPADHFAVFRSLTKWSSVDKESLYAILGVSIHNPRRTCRHRLCDPETFRTRVRGRNLIRRNETALGIPQGTPISALLSNIYMLEFDVAVQAQVSALGGAYYRYCDDILVIVPTGDKRRMMEFIDDAIRGVQLVINDKKTCVSRFSCGPAGLAADHALQYLGFTFDGQRILIRSAALARYSEKMKKAVRLAKKTAAKRNLALAEAGEEPRPLYRKQIYTRYSHLGRRNFLRYGYRAAVIMKSRAIRKQLKPLWKRLQEEIER